MRSYQALFLLTLPLVVVQHKENFVISWAGYLQSRATLTSMKYTTVDSKVKTCPHLQTTKNWKLCWWKTDKTNQILKDECSGRGIISNPILLQPSTDKRKQDPDMLP